MEVNWTTAQRENAQLWNNSLPVRIYCWYQCVFQISVITLCRPVFTHLMSTDSLVIWLTGLFCPNFSFCCFPCLLIAFCRGARLRLSYDFLIFPLWNIINRRMLFSRISFVKRLFRGLCVAFYWLAAQTRWQLFWWGAKTVKIFRGLNLEVCFCKNCLCSIELIGYVDLSDFHETWPECLTGINAPKCVRLLRNSKYFSRGRPRVWRGQNNFLLSNFKVDLLGNQ